MKKFSAIFVCFVVMLFSGILFAESGEAIVIEFGADDVYRNLTAEELGVTDVFYIAGKRGYPGIPILMDMVDYGRNDFTLAYLTYLDGKKIIKTKQLIINRDYPFNLLRDIDIVNPIANEYNFVKDKFDYEIELSENDQYFKFKPIGLSVQSYEVRNNGLIDHIADVKVKANREPFDVVPLHEGMNTVWIKTILYNQVSYNYKFNIYNPPMVSDKNYNPVITTTGPATAFKTLTVVDPDELDSVNLLVESPSITLDEVYKTINMKIEGYDGQTYEIWNNDKLIESNKLENNKTKFPTTPLEIGRNSIEVKLIINKFVQKVYSLELENINDGRYLEGMFLYNTFGQREPLLINGLVQEHDVALHYVKIGNKVTTTFEFDALTRSDLTIIKINNDVVEPSPLDGRYRYTFKGFTDVLNMVVDYHGVKTYYRFNVNGPYSKKPNIAHFTLDRSEFNRDHNIRWVEGDQPVWWMPMQDSSITFTANTSPNTTYLLRGREYANGETSIRFPGAGGDLVLPVTVRKNNGVEEDYDIEIKKDPDYLDVKLAIVSSDDEYAYFERTDVDAKYEIEDTIDTGLNLFIDSVDDGTEVYLNCELLKTTKYDGVQSYYFIPMYVGNVITVELGRDGKFKTYIIRFVNE